MKLVSAQPGQVVRNVNNGSHYRFERQERSKVRIWPLELFPNGLLIPKPTPTTIEPDLEVLSLGMWYEGMTVEGQPTRSRRVYEKELVRRERELPELRAQYEALPRSGTGEQSRGSFANRVKYCEMRIEVLKRGLGFTNATPVRATELPDELPSLSRGDLVQVPSGRPAKVLGFQAMGDQTYVKIKTMFQGAALEAALPCEVLRDWSQASLCTV